MDSPTVLDREDGCPLVPHHVFWWTHDVNEDAGDMGSSKSNTHEAHMAIALASSWVKEGVKEEKISILAPYSGQIRVLRKAAENVIPNVVIKTVDRYQGDENDHVILSLVRKNDMDVVGFLKRDNRMIVATSRARYRFVIIGNQGMFDRASPVWKRYIESLVEDGAISNTLPLCCPRHPMATTSVKDAGELTAKLQNMCKEQCVLTYPACGHQCTRVCHLHDDRDTCLLPCEQEFAECGHRCKKNCGQPCSSKCNEKVPSDPLPNCEHRPVVRCSERSKPRTCTELCTKTLACSHPCKLECGKACTSEACEICARECEAALADGCAAARERLEKAIEHADSGTGTAVQYKECSLEDPALQPVRNLLQHLKCESNGFVAVPIKIVELTVPPREHYDHCRGLHDARFSDLFVLTNLIADGSSALWDAYNEEFIGRRGDEVEEAAEIKKESTKAAKAKSMQGTSIPAFCTHLAKNTTAVLLCDVMGGRKKNETRPRKEVLKLGGFGGIKQSTELARTFTGRKKHDVLRLCSDVDDATTILVKSAGQVLPRYEVHFEWKRPPMSNISSWTLTAEEKDALTPSSSNDLVRVDLWQHRLSDRTTPYSDHFALALHRFRYFQRAQGSASSIKMTGMSLVVNPVLYQRYFDARTKLRDAGRDQPDEQLAFHGTGLKATQSIFETGFRDPQHPDYNVANGNVFGDGIYFSTEPIYSANFARRGGAQKLILSRVLPLPEERNKGPTQHFTVITEAERTLPLYEIDFITQ